MLIGSCPAGDRIAQQRLQPAPEITKIDRDHHITLDLDDITGRGRGVPALTQDVAVD
jgi:hypothetical protein